MNVIITLISNHGISNMFLSRNTLIFSKCYFMSLLMSLCAITFMVPKWLFFVHSSVWKYSGYRVTKYIQINIIFTSKNFTWIFHQDFMHFCYILCTLTCMPHINNLNSLRVFFYIVFNFIVEKSSTYLPTLQNFNLKYYD